MSRFLGRAERLMAQRHCKELQESLKLAEKTAPHHRPLFEYSDPALDWEDEGDVEYHDCTL
jgi:hypothetical protein